MIDKLGISSFDGISRLCYPGYVVEIYANLHKDKFDNYISIIKSCRIVLNADMLHSFMKFNVYSEQEVFIKKGLVKIDGFRNLEQLKFITGHDKVSKFVLPTTSSVLPMAHLIFKLCWSNICPRISNRSNFRF